MSPSPPPTGPQPGGQLPPPGQADPPTPRSSAALVATIGGIIALCSLLASLAAWWYPDPGKEPSGPEERAPYLAQVDSLCQRSVQAMSALGQQPADPATSAYWWGEVARVYRALVVDWANVDYPDRDEVLVRGMLDPLEQIGMEAASIAHALLQGDNEMANQVFLRFRDASSEYRRNSRSYGLRACPQLS